MDRKLYSSYITEFSNLLDEFEWYTDTDDYDKLDDIRCRLDNLFREVLNRVAEGNSL